MANEDNYTIYDTEVWRCRKPLSCCPLVQGYDNEENISKLLIRLEIKPEYIGDVIQKRKQTLKCRSMLHVYSSINYKL